MSSCIKGLPISNKGFRVAKAMLELVQHGVGCDFETARQEISKLYLIIFSRVNRKYNMEM